MRTVTLLAVLVAVGCIASGCVTHAGGVAASSKPLDPGGYKIATIAEGTSWGWSLFGIPFKQASTAVALREAVRESGGDALIQISVDNRDYFLLVLEMQRIKVEGIGVTEE